MANSPAGINSVTQGNNVWMNVQGGTRNLGASTIVYSGGLQANDYWMITNVSGSNFAIMSCVNGGYLTANAAASKTSTIPAKNSNFNDPTQLWTFADAGSGLYYIQSVAYPGSVLDKALNAGSGGWSTNDCITYPKNSGPNQQWKLTLVVPQF